MTHEKRLAVVTGGAAGIGWGIGQALASDGLHVVLLDKSDDVQVRAQELNDRGGSAEGETVDLMDLDQVEAFINRLRADRGHADVLVNNAGVHMRKADGRKYSLAELPLEVWEDSFRLNLTVPFLLCKGLVPLMAEQGWGRVINVASRGARTAVPVVGAQYASSKTGMVGLTRAVAAEFGVKGVTANCIAPGRIETPAEAAAAADERVAARKEFLLGRTGRIDEIGAVASFLASEGSSFVTGAVIDANGGSFVG
ncbi:SDR family NAD(P)-dependent oxidoreductase [Modestobacter excelsi]|uniref:SDR family NAD(P)-dependent oxidoreductase n=1 Tax=Modestobacter excelsi TaxID=2213161 RepID=UPI00110C8ED0|nr:SDR family NAD(P)-dependent oxidoreductase [Modestobacter excelsi]